MLVGQMLDGSLKAVLDTERFPKGRLTLQQFTATRTNHRSVTGADHSSIRAARRIPIASEAACQ